MSEMKMGKLADLAAVGLLLTLATMLFGGEAKPKPGPAEKPKPAKKKDKEPAKKKEPPEPIHVWAERIRYIREHNLARITGDATIIQRDLRIDCDSVRAILDPKTQRFKRVIATGNVRIHNVVPIPKDTIKRPPLKPGPEKRRAACERAEYNPTTEVVILLGAPKKQPVVWIGEDQAQADLITLDNKNNVIYFEGRAKIAAKIAKEATETEAPGKAGKATTPTKPTKAPAPK